jgi:cation diffusion facilitator family transporter
MLHTSHDFQKNTENAEFRTKIVMFLTGAMMIVEIITGIMFNSMALLADGWHMSTHMSAFLIAVIAYSFARKNRSNKRFTFGTGKIGVLGGFTSSILLIIVAVIMIKESIDRLMNPAEILFLDALIVACIGLLVNVISAFILKDNKAHTHSHEHGHDTNLKAAYLHVIADAFTSVTAIIALLIGFFYGIKWIDSVMGFLGSLVILIWAYGMIKDTVAILVDYYPKKSDLEEEITKAINSIGNTKIEDLHIWQVASGKYASIISLSSTNPKQLKEYYDSVNQHEELVHISIQISKIGDA